MTVRISDMRNDEGKYAFIFNNGTKSEKYQTEFIYDTMKVLHRYYLCVGRLDSEGKTKYGVICTKGYASGFFVPCVFDKIKIYDGTDLIATKDGEKYAIIEDGEVQAWSIYELYQKYQ